MRKPKEREPRNFEKYFIADNLNRATCSPVGALPVGASDFLGPRGLYSTQRIISFWSANCVRGFLCSGEQKYFNSWSSCDRTLDLQDHASYLIDNA